MLCCLSHVQRQVLPRVVASDSNAEDVCVAEKYMLQPSHTHVNDLQRHLLVTRKIGSGVQGVWGCIFREGNAVGTHF